MRYRSKIVEILAWQYVHGRADLWPEWLKTAHLENKIAEGFGDDQRLDIVTIEGTMRAKPGDWIIFGTEGELYPCKDSVFQRKYEAVA